jgi:hypothetical protein
MSLLCTVLGHRYRFSAEGDVLRWHCRRSCGSEGQKRYACPEQAARYAAAFDHEDIASLGRRAPYFGLLPLRLWHWARQRGQRATR